MYTLPKPRPDPDFILSQWRKIAIAGLTYVLAVVLLFAVYHTRTIYSYGSNSTLNWGIASEWGGVELRGTPGPFVCRNFWPHDWRKPISQTAEWLSVDC